jgi:branched-chain amino acid aminotransferase
MNGIVYAAGGFRPAAEAVVSVFDHGLLYGDGVFEGIRAYNGRVFKLERHIERLFDSAQALRLEIRESAERVSELVLETCRRNEVVDGYVRLIVTRGAGSLGIDPRSCARSEIIVIAQPMLSIAPEPITVVTSSFRRMRPDALNPSIKSLNYLNNVLARLEAGDHGAGEALLLDADGYVAEATAENVFIVTRRGLLTPPTATNLKGITRETVLEIAHDLDVHTEEHRFTLFDLWTAREAFLCGTFAEVVPVRSVDGRAIGTGAPGPITSRIISAFARLVRSTGTAIAAPETQDAIAVASAV